MKIMNLITRFAFSISVCTAMQFDTSLWGQAMPPEDMTAYAPGELLIKFKTAATDAQLLHAWQGAGLGLIKSIKFKEPNHPGMGV